MRIYIKIIGIFIFLIGQGMLPMHGIAQDEKDVPTLSIGEPAPDFNLPGIDNRNYSLLDFKDFPILVVLFTCNHCPTAQAYEDRIINMVEKYRPLGVGFVAIMPNSGKALSLAELGYSDLGDDLSDMIIRAKDKKFNFPYLFDGDDQKISMKYGPVATPHVFVFDNQRKLKYTGRIDDTENPYIQPNTEDLKITLEALLHNKPVPVEKTKTFGCSLKWAWKDHWKNEQINEWAREPVKLDSINTTGITSLIENNTPNLLLINIWATWCGPCVMEFPELININRMYQGRDFKLITISSDKITKKDKVREFLVKNQASCQNYIFSSDNKYDLIEAVDKEWQGSLPYTILVAPGGKIVYRVSEAFDPLALKKHIVEFLGRYYADDK